MGSGRPDADRVTGRLDGRDGAFLALESATTPLHIAGVHLFDVTGLRGGLDVHRVREVVATRLDRMPVLRTRVVEASFGFQHPVRVEEDWVELDYHVRRASLPRPGGPTELAALVADLVERPLDRSRPLWEFHVVEGLDHGHVALVTKVHHALIDGLSGAELLATLFDLEPGRPGQPPARGVPTGGEGGPPSQRESAGGGVEQLRSVLGAVPAQADVFARALGATARSARSLSGRNLAVDGVLPPSPFQAPRTSINRAISAHRRVALAEVALDDVQRARSVLGGTVNDVVLAMASSGMRALFAGRDEKPQSSLVAMVPVSTRQSMEQGSSGNQVAAMLVSLATGVADPVARLQRIRENVRVAKEQHAVLSPDLFARWAESLLPVVGTRISKLVTSLHLFDHVPPPFNLVVSNVPGPQVPLYLGGARMVAMYPIGPVVEGVGVNITVFSYCGVLSIGVQGCWALVPDVGVIARGMVSELAVLVKEADRRDRPVPWWHGESDVQPEP